MEHKKTFRKKGMKLVDTNIERRTDITCFQETKRGGKFRKSENSWYRLCFTGKEKYRNRVGIIAHKKLRENVVDVKRLVIQ